MHTLRLAVDPHALDDPASAVALVRAAEILRHGGLVAFPTETVYGLGANALDPAAVARIFHAKDRPSWDPVIVHIAGLPADNLMLHALVAALPDAAHRLIEAFWPGPLTLLLPRSSAVPHAVTAGRPLVAIRMPAHPVAARLIALAGVPVAAPSANRFGHTSPTTAQHVLDDLDGRIDAILDAGPAHHGLESTVLDPNSDPMVLYRPGAITTEQIAAVAGPVVLHSPTQSTEDQPPEALPSPGVGLRHYAPRAQLILVDAPFAELPAHLARAAAAHAGKHVGLLLPAELSVAAPQGAEIFPWGSWHAPETLAQSLYAGLRALDAAGCAVILCPLPPAEGLGAALHDRLRKAARPA
ncbi:MAG TPA: L-threonylcarbamoyladenylate synthase [Terracidiphilus sp.]|nr:L-threonylcarbamoyladenylate synthase [Terracidiphilus sp.]